MLQKIKEIIGNIIFKCDHCIQGMQVKSDNEYLKYFAKANLLYERNNREYTEIWRAFKHAFKKKD